MFNPVIIVPCYNHAAAFERFAVKLAKIGLPVIVVDDGSQPPQSRKLRHVCAGYGFKYIHNWPNAGKGGAMKTGFQVAMDTGYTHGLQIDADGQHDVSDITKFLN